ncbi:MAG TPA: hypothetical protein VGD88_16365 [Opitutaceae bacterium]
MPSPLGSNWHRWDLHVHTLDSLVHDYADPDPWARFLAGLRALANNAYGFPNGSFLPVGYPVAANPPV